MSIWPYFSVFSATIIFVLFLIPLAIRFNLVDTPNDRKNHLGNVPLIGGIAMFFGTSLGLIISGIVLLDSEIIFLILSSFILILVGIVDDYVGISPKIRFVFQTIAALIIIYFGGVLLKDLGSLFSIENVHLELFALIFSLFAIIGVLNSLNFSDGIDGMSSSLSLVTFASVAFFAFQAKDLIFYFVSFPVLLHS